MGKGVGTPGTFLLGPAAPRAPRVPIDSYFFPLGGPYFLDDEATAWTTGSDHVRFQPMAHDRPQIPTMPTLMLLAATTAASQIELVVSAHDMQPALEMANTIRVLAYIGGSATFFFPVISSVPVADLLGVFCSPATGHRGVVPGVEFAVLEPTLEVIPARPEWRSNTQHLCWRHFASAIAHVSAWQRSDSYACDA